MMKQNVLLKKGNKVFPLMKQTVRLRETLLFCLVKHLLFAYLLLNQNNFSMFATLFMKNMTFV